METSSSVYSPREWPFLTQTNDERNLLIAITTFDHDSLRYLLPRVGANTPILGERPLRYAIKCKNYDAILYLLRKGAVVEHGGTILHVAVILEDVPLVYILLRKNHDPNVLDRKGRSPLVHAFRRMNPMIISVLLKYGANVNVIDEKKKTLLHYLTQDVPSCEEILHVILLYKPDLTLLDMNGETAIDIYRRLRFNRLLSVINSQM